MSAVTGIIGGIQGASAAHDAADKSNKGYLQAGNTVVAAKNDANSTLGDAAKAGQAGMTTAAGTAAAGVNDATGTANAGIGGAARDAQGNVTSAGQQAGANVTATGQQAGANVVGAGQTAGANVTGAAGTANAGLDQYAQTGGAASRTLGDLTAPGGALMHNFGTADMTADDGYQFRLQQGQQALNRAAAASGTAGGGGAMKAMSRYNQGAASDEYQAAFNRNQTQNNDRFNHLNSLSESGRLAAGTQGTNLMDASKYAGDQSVNAQKYAGDQNMTASKYAGDQTVGAAKYAGDVGNVAATAMGKNTIDAAGYGGDAQLKAAGYNGLLGQAAAQGQSANTMNAGRYQGDAQSNAANALANGDLGAAHAWNGMLSSVGSAANSFLTGGFSGGGYGIPGVGGAPGIDTGSGFSLRGALGMGRG